jgi:hypothetical protein
MIKLNMVKLISKFNLVVNSTMFDPKLIYHFKFNFLTILEFFYLSMFNLIMLV